MPGDPQWIATNATLLPAALKVHGTFVLGFSRHLSWLLVGVCPGFTGSGGKSLGLKLRARLPLYSRPSESSNSRKPISDLTNPYPRGPGQRDVSHPRKPAAVVAFVLALALIASAFFVLLTRKNSGRMYAI